MNSRNDVLTQAELTIALASVFRRSADRARLCDPVGRNSMLVNVLATFVDFGMISLKTYVRHLRVTLEVVPAEPGPEHLAGPERLAALKRLAELEKQVDEFDLEWKNDLQDLFTYIQQPTFSPDHPKGRSLMKEAQQHFTAAGVQPPEKISPNDSTDSI